MLVFLLIIVTLAPFAGIKPAPWGPPNKLYWDTIGFTELEENTTFSDFVVESKLPSLHL